MRKIVIAVSLVLTAALAVVVTAAIGHGGGGGGNVKLTGYQEVPAKSTLARGRFAITDVDRSAKTLQWRLTYSGLEGGTVVGAHLHLGQQGVNGEIILPFCGPCPGPSATLTGTATNAEIGATSAPPANQGIVKGEATAFEELLRAIRNGAVYVNVHTTNHPGGEIRAQLGHHNRGWHRGKKKHDD